MDFIYYVNQVCQSVVFFLSSTKSEFLLECEEEELEPWQKETSHVQLKDEEDNGVLSMSHQILEEHVGVFKHTTSFKMK